MTDVTCPACGAANPAGSAFCEACGADLPSGNPAAAPAPSADPGPAAAASPGEATPLLPPSWSPTPMPASPTPGSPGAPAPSLWATPIPARVIPAVPATAGEESPLDIGWTGVVPGRASAYDAAPVAVRCGTCGEGHYQDGYCDQCGAKQPNPRDHLEEAPATWVAGVSDIGRRHATNEDALALAAQEAPLSGATLVVCDGVSNTTHSEIASLAAARAARTVLEQPLSNGMGVANAARAAAYKRLGDAVTAANEAVIATTKAGDPNSPSCTFTGAIVSGATAYVGNVGDSRIYWLPDGGSGARQVSTDDSVAAERIATGVERKVAETGPMAHSITRWLGIDAPDDLTPHLQTVELSEPGWLMLCSDGLWNYCSEAQDLQAKIGELLAAGTPAEPLPLARALVGFANNAGGVDNITVGLVRVPGANETSNEATASNEVTAPGEAAAEQPPPALAGTPSASTAGQQPTGDPNLAGSATTEGENDGAVHG